MGIDLNKSLGGYLKATDVQDGPIRGPIDRIEVKAFKDQNTGNVREKYVLYLVGEKRGLPLNAGNRNTLILAFEGKEDIMKGKTVELREGKVTNPGQHFGKPCVEVHVPKQED